MKQLLQNMKNGKTEVKELPIPVPGPRTALVRTAWSLVSAGTEKTLVDFAEKNLIGKAASRPDLVRQVVDKAKREGLLTTMEAALNRLDQPMYPGYSSAGIIVALGDDMPGFRVGDRVACGGGGFATHAEYNVVPRNLLVKLPSGVQTEEAAFATLGAVGMHGFRLAAPLVNESVLIIGLGLLGLMTMQIALAAGCRVLGLDISENRVALAKSLGGEACLRSAVDEVAPSFTKNRGFDHVLICAGSKDNDSIELAGVLCRDRGTVIAVGAVGLEIPRKIYYEKELRFMVSRSYGPGRYDANYEEKGQDYPLGYVRWTEGRNMEAFIDLLESGKMNVQALISHKIPIESGEKAYELITGKLGEPFLGVLLEYPQKNDTAPENMPIRIGTEKRTPGPVTIGVLGAGNYANATFLPALIKTARPIRLASIASGSGGSAVHAAEKFGIEKVDVSGSAVLDDPEVNTVMLLTRHHLHARQVVHALRNKKNVYCEKPLALTIEELSEIRQIVKENPEPVLTVGYNRRFAPLSRQLFDFFVTSPEPLAIHYTANAGYIPPNHWTQDPAIGGGRLLGEACHFIDFLTWLTRSRPISVSAAALPDNGRYSQDNFSLQFKFENGSFGTVTYVANGDKAYPKERCEVFSGGKVAVLNDFRTLDTWQDGRHRQIKSALRQDKGHAAAIDAFLASILQGQTWPIPLDELLAVSLAGFAAQASLRENDAIVIPGPEAF